MHSIPIAMTWELLRKSQWQSIMALLGANLVPVLLLTALRLEGALDITDPAIITLQFVAVQLTMVTFAAAALMAQEFAPRTFSLPVATSTLVAWRMLPSMVLVFVETLLSLSALNLVFGLDWPVWGPALVAPVALAMVQSAVWFSEKSILSPFIVGAVAVVISLWFKSRYGAIFAQPQHVWSTVTPAEVLTLLAFTVISYFVGIVGVSRNRSGESLASFNLVAWMEQVFARPFQDSRQSARSAIEAQYWSEWTKKGMLLPAVVCFALLFGMGIWLFFNRNPAELVEGFVVGGGLLSAMGLVGGLIAGNCGRNDTKPEMGQFLATRPLSNRALARIILRVAARSVVICWLIWVAVFGVVVGVLVLTGNRDRLAMIGSANWWSMHWWYVPATLLGCWIVVATVASAYLSGRPILLAKIVSALLAFYVAVMLSAKLLDWNSRFVVTIVLLTITGLALVVIAVWLMIAALRRSVLSAAEVCSAGFVWAGLSVVAVFECLRQPLQSPGTQLGTAILLVGIAAFAVVPFAAAPLSIAWNRHR